jgi:peptide/nickel transport system ATP-binding protein
MGLLPSTAQITGAIEFEGQSLLGLDDNRLSKIRGKDLAMVFQDPLSALTPVYTVGDQIAEALRLHDSHLSARRRGAAPSSCSRSSGFPMPSVVRRRSRTNTRAACASAP